MAEQVHETNETLEKVISTAIQIPGVKVNRNAFLCEVFKSVTPEMRNQILEVGPVEAGCSRSELKKIAKGIVDKRTLASTGASFVAGLPGGLAMAATIPADTLQFYAVALRLAQEISYIYGEPDLWDGGTLSEERVSHQLILYCGVLFGASGASATVRVLSSNLAKQALKKLPQKALTKTFYYPVIKSICKALGIKMTKSVFAKGVSKAIPLIGGVVSGGITFASMRPMGNRLVDTFDDCKFDYTQEEFEADWQEINSDEFVDVEVCEPVLEAENSAEKSGDDIVTKLREYKSLLDDGIISEDEFTELKAILIQSTKGN